jgi:uncharacterized membrane protein YfcA
MGKFKNRFKNIAMGLVIGIVNGFFGSAGGIVAVESMEREDMEDKKAHATALFVIFPISVLSAFLYIKAGYFLWDAVLYTGIGATVGGIIGAVALKKLNTLFVNRLFTLIILATGVRMLF